MNNLPNMVDSINPPQLKTPRHHNMISWPSMDCWS